MNEHDASFATVLADINFPSASICKEGPELVRADGKSHHGALVLRGNLFKF